MQKELPEIGDVRQAGLHIGLELVTGPATGLLAAVRNSGNCIWNYNYSRMSRGK
jgi:4-aminobutyrate aminotransferase-like enzyme